MYSTKDEDDWYDCPVHSKMKYGSLLKKKKTHTHTEENPDFFFPCNLLTDIKKYYQNIVQNENSVEVQI